MNRTDTPILSTATMLGMLRRSNCFINGQLGAAIEFVKKFYPSAPGVKWGGTHFTNSQYEILRAQMQTATPHPPYNLITARQQLSNQTSLPPGMVQAQDDGKAALHAVPCLGCGLEPETNTYFRKNDQYIGYACNCGALVLNGIVVGYR